MSEEPSQTSFKTEKTTNEPTQSPGRRNLIVCIDGTSNQFGIQNTNVVQLYQSLSKDDDQLTYYNSGIGTYANLSRISPKYLWQTCKGLLQSALAWNVEEIVVDAYRWLAENYQTGDVIYFFGFSRGAYQVRALAGMIQRVGLIHKGNVAQIPFAYELYISQKAKESSNYYPFWITGPIVIAYIAFRSCMLATVFLVLVVTPVTIILLCIRVVSLKTLPTLLKWSFLAWSILAVGLFLLQATSSSFHEYLERVREKTRPKKICSADHLAEAFKKSFSWPDVKVHFVGCWDTVSSIGFFRRTTLPLTDQMDHVDIFRHALALDECRVKFVPEYTVSKGTAPLKDERGRFRVKEVWFRGFHSDVGGNNPLLKEAKGGDTDSGLDDIFDLNPSSNRVRFWNPSLQWMIEEACQHELRLCEPPDPIKSNEKLICPVTDSMSFFWSLIEWLPVKWPSYANDKLSLVVHRHRSQGRQILVNQRIHFSALLEGADKYTPHVTFPELKVPEEATHSEPSEPNNPDVGLTSFSTKLSTLVIPEARSEPSDIGSISEFKTPITPHPGKQNNNHSLWRALHKAMIDHQQVPHYPIEYDDKTYTSYQKFKDALGGEMQSSSLYKRTSEEGGGIAEMIWEDITDSCEEIYKALCEPFQTNDDADPKDDADSKAVG